MTRTPSRRTFTTLPFAALLALTACSEDGVAPAASTPSPSPTPAAGRFTLAAHQVGTDLGEVTVPQDPRRVVVLNFALAGYLYDLGVPVTALTSETTAGERTPSPSWADRFRDAGTQWLPWGDDGFNLEAVAALRPDLIVGGGIGFPLKLARDAYDDLSAIAPTVVVSGDLDTWQEQYAFLADDVFDRPDVHRRALADHESRVERVRSAITPPPGPAVVLSVTADQRAYVLVEDRGLPAVLSSVGIEVAPLFASGRYQPYVAGGDSFEVSAENLGTVVTQPTVFVLGFNGAAVDVETLRRNPVFAALPAFAAGRAHDLPSWAYRGDHHETAALLDQLQRTFS